jgi:PmbA protein
MNLENTTQKIIDLLKKYPTTGYEFSLSESSGVSTAVRLGKVETLEYHLDKSFDISVYLGNKKGHSSSVDLSEKGLKKTIESAHLIAKYTQEDPFNGLAPKALMAFSVPDLDLYHPWALEANESIELASECEAAALEQAKIDNSEGAEVSSLQGQSVYANSTGLVAKQQSTRHSLHCSVIAKHQSDMQTAYEYSTALDKTLLRNAQWVGRQAGELAIQKLGAQALSARNCPVIFTPRLSGSLFSQLISALGGSAQYKKSSFLLKSLDQLVLPESISLFENPLVQKTLGAKAFDLNGVLKKAQHFVKDGRVQSYVMGQYSANQLGLKTTANAGGVNNLIVQHTFSKNLEEMIKEMHQGLVVTELMGQGVNLTTGDYSRGALGFWVENGKIAYPVSGITIAGNLKTMLLGIRQIGTDVDERSHIKVGSVLIEQMTIAGEG